MGEFLPCRLRRPCPSVVPDAAETPANLSAITAESSHITVASVERNFCRRDAAQKNQKEVLRELQRRIRAVAAAIDTTLSKPPPVVYEGRAASTPGAMGTAVAGWTGEGEGCAG